MSNPTISRREFLAGSAAALASISIRAPQRIVIIGAGLAGLVAAYELNLAGHQVTVLEARDRPGGRVLTLREPFSDGLYAEAGALFVPNHHTDTMKWIRRFSLPLENVLGRGASELYSLRGKRIIMREGARTNWPLELTAEEREAGLSGIWDRYVTPLVKKMGDVASANWPPESLAPLDKVSFYDLLRKQGASTDAIALMRLGYLDLWGDGIEYLSALSILRDLALRQGEQESFAIKGGNDQLPKAFASRLKSNIRYGAAVTKIVHTSSRVSAQYKQGDEEKQIEADRLLCAIPFSTLRQIEVTPPFSLAKRTAIDELPYTSVARVFLQTSRRVWTDQGLPGIANTDLPVMWLWEPTVNQPGKRGIIESYTAGAAARKITAMKESERLQFALDQMEKVYPGLKSAYEKGASKCWDTDPWSRGDYAWFKPGQVTSLLPHIAKSEGRIHFAGEHASAHPGWMQGALESGSRAAREIMEAAGR